MTAPLTPEERRILLRLAREALEAAVAGKRLPPLDVQSLPDTLRRNAATFVTLTRGGLLRGCIGALHATMPLAEDVRVHAAAAALEDYRFPPLREDEVNETEIEISVLTEPEPLGCDSPEDLIHRLRPGVDGVILISGLQRATFLPQVWEKVPEARLFLSMLCEKAGMRADAWQRGDVEVQTYQVESFHEAEGAQS